MTERPTNTIPDKQHKADHKGESHSHAPLQKKEEKETKEEKKPKVEVKVVKKEEAIALGRSAPASMKHGMHISRFIKHKNIDKAMADLDEVLAMRRPIPFSGEIPHRKGKGMMSGRYPINAIKEFKHVLKSLKGNCIANGMDLDKTVITESSASYAARPMRKGGVWAKRINIIIKAREMKK